jgi:hypothetical protein
MPKKIVVKKKKVKKPKAPVLIPRQLPRTKCCENYKTGSAFTIPLGYSDRLGMNRLAQPTPNVTNIYYQQPSQPLAKVEPNRNNTFSIQTQTEQPQSIRIPIQTEPQSIRIPITYKPIPVKNLYKPVEFQPLEETLPSIPITSLENKNIVIKPKQEPFLSFEDIYQEPPAPPPPIKKRVVKKSNKKLIIINEGDVEEENVVMSQPALVETQPVAEKKEGRRADIFIVADLLVKQKPDMTYEDALNYAESLKQQGALTDKKKKLQDLEKQKEEAQKEQKRQEVATKKIQKALLQKYKGKKK